MAKKTKKRWISAKTRYAVIDTIKKYVLTTYRILSFSVFSPESYRRATATEPPVNPLKKKLKWYSPKRIPLKKIATECGMRVLETPVLALLVIAFTVFSAVHPNQDTDIGVAPNALGLYYETITFDSKDGTDLNGWFIPSINASQILEEGNDAILRKRPGVVLCHGIGTNRKQMLPLAAFLNSKGYEVLLFDFRSAGLSASNPRSFGLNERDDVLAAVHYLQETSSIDPTRVGVIGQDMGGVAALWAAGYDHSIQAVAIADVYSNFREAVERKLARAGMFTETLTSAFVWGCKAWFHTTDQQFSAITAADNLNQHQSLLVISRQKNQTLETSTARILQHSKAKSDKLIINKTGASVLTDTTLVGPAIADFLGKAMPEEEVL